jgi:hypothetical protein
VALNQQQHKLQGHQQQQQQQQQPEQHSAHKGELHACIDLPLHGGAITTHESRQQHPACTGCSVQVACGAACAVFCVGY